MNPVYNHKFPIHPLSKSEFLATTQLNQPTINEELAAKIQEFIKTRPAAREYPREVECVT